MASNNLWVIIRAIHYGGEITTRQIRLMLACESKKACRLLGFVRKVLPHAT